MMTDLIQFFSSSPLQFLFAITIIALFVGSFLNVLIHRLPIMMQKEWEDECREYLRLKPNLESPSFNLWLPFSHCPNCQTPIRPWHNIPLFSYLFLRGKCAYCQQAISFRYPFIEILTALASFYVAWKFGFSLHTLAALLFTWISIALVFIDIDHHLLPDQLTLSLLWLGLFFSLFNLFCSPEEAIIGAIAGYFIFALTQLIFGWLTQKTGIGQGDFKLLAALGAFLGWKMLPLIILLASITGVIITVLLMIIRGNFKSEPLPFGPYLAIAGFAALLYGPEILSYYFKWFF